MSDTLAEGSKFRCLSGEFTFDTVLAATFGYFNGEFAVDTVLAA
jgi:hypothetical protein